MMGKKPSRQDLLSDLPLGIIHIILSFVPLRDAIGTSLLSRKWRYIWASLPYLAFDMKCVNPLLEETEMDEKNEVDEKRLIRFISQALLLHKGPIHKFEVHLPDMVEPQFVDQWLLFLSRNDIGILVLDNSWIDLHSSLFSCQSLTNLTLDVNSIPPPPPSFKGFLSLRSLSIWMDEESPIESFVALSPLLENFKLVCYSGLKMPMTICAPNLKHFHLDYAPAHLSLCTPLLEEFVVYFSGTKSFSIEGESLLFHHLRTIELYNGYFSNKEVTPDVIRLINGSPNLQKLVFSCWTFFESEALELAFASLWDSDFSYTNLKVIKIVSCGNGEMKLIKFLLARSPVLEKMIYKPRAYLSDLELLKLTAKLVKYRRASANAKIVILDDRVTF